ncbi:hypothetical protein JRO89_XS15G0027300 [Xanthoceras sorbifolium]|uniref:Uncharacterized protein n=1 Tax=Xanthoceras sorbifolium TaxID=99658 RepID=A0ABQ8H0U8_9ROSI|nr:hypothetical protein JRO89_XS15G0027300 [Xanthoceras sorbifolium]
MKDPPKNRVDDDRVEDQVEAHVEAPVDDDGVLEDRTDDPVEDRVEDAADNRVKARKRVWWIVAWVGSVVATFMTGQAAIIASFHLCPEHLAASTGDTFSKYCLLGLMQGSGINGLDEFMIGELPKSLKNNASTMIGFVVDGIGNFLGILFVYANRQRFSATMNESHLDKYNFQLMILTFLNMC